MDLSQYDICTGILAAVSLQQKKETTTKNTLNYEINNLCARYEQEPKREHR